MRYYKECNEKGFVIEVGAGDALDGIEITQEEYDTLLADMEAKMQYAEQVYHQEISIDDVPAEWREEVQYLVDRKIATEGAFDPNEISDAEAVAIITGGVDA